jgi:hypothetical protein
MLFLASTRENPQGKYRARPPTAQDPIDSNSSSSLVTPSSANIVRCQSLARTVYETRSLDLFWEAYLPNGQPLPPSVTRIYTCGWTEIAQKLYNDDDCLRYALWANSLGNIGIRDGEKWIQEEGLKMYGRALTELSKGLSNPNRVTSDALLAAVKLMSTFEVWLGLEGWLFTSSPTINSCRARYSSVEKATPTLIQMTPGRDIAPAN